MIVYGDAEAIETAEAKRTGIAEHLDRAARTRPGIERHALLVAALIEAGELVQGLADAGFAARGEVDEEDPSLERPMALACALAAAVGASWDTAFAPVALAPMRRALDAVHRGDDALTIRRAEGFAHYALYPEAYWVAARALGPRGDAVVIGIRSVGTTLAAVVAIGLGAAAPRTVRPVGHPFRRRLSLGPRLALALAAHPDRTRAIVDEGPGLSGSSFGAVADSLEAGGVAPEALAFFPSHGGDLGPEASERHRRRWRAARRATVDFDALTGSAAQPAHRVEAWVADLTGPPLRPVQDLAGGRWRAFTLDRTGCPVDPQNEKRKLLLTSAGGRTLLRFVGLGRVGLDKYAMARDLAAAGFGLEPLGWRHGFLVERWHDDARPVALDGDRRGALLERLGAYLGWRAARWPAPAASGATPAALHAMAVANIEEGLGPSVARAMDRWSPARLADLAARSKRVRIDGRLHPWEWLTLPGGVVVKTDALDHHASHDLIGCQDIAWDVAGAAVEWSLSRGERETLAAGLARAGTPVDAGLITFFLAAYPAFQLGVVSMAAGRAEPAERPRLEARLGFYRRAILAALA